MKGEQTFHLCFLQHCFQVKLWFML